MSRGKRKGFKYDHHNSQLEVWVDGTEIGYFDSDEFVLNTGMDLDLTADKVMIDFHAGVASAVDPGDDDKEAGWINIAVDGTTYYIPYFDVA